MKQLTILPILFGLFSLPLFSQCRIALDTLDEFDTTRLIATHPFDIGYLVASGNVAEDLEGEEFVPEAKAIFSYANEHGINSFFLTLGVVERKFYMIENDFTVRLKFKDGQIFELFNVPDAGEFDREILLWKYTHTCVVPIEIFQLMKFERVEKIRITYKNYKRTIELEEAQQIGLQQAVKCVEERLNRNAVVKP